MENKEPKSGTPAAATNNGSTHTSGQQQPVAAPTWAGEKEKILNAIHNLSTSALGLSERILFECECIEPDTAERTINNIHDMAELQDSVKTVIDYLTALLEEDVLEMLDNNSYPQLKGRTL